MGGDWGGVCLLFVADILASGRDLLVAGMKNWVGIGKQKEGYNKSKMKHVLYIL